MIAFPKELQIQNIEIVLSRIHHKQDDLLLPIESKSSYFGGLASAIQCVNTWARLSEQYKLICQSDDKPFKEQQESIIQNPYKFSAVLMAKNIEYPIREEKLDIKNSLYSKANLQVDNQSQNQYGSHRGNICNFAFVDHSSKGFDRNFYLHSEGGKASIRSDKQVKQIIRAMIDKTFYTTGGAAPLTEDDYNAVGRVFTELFKNTHEHGSRRTKRDDWLRPGVRTIFTKSLNMNKAGAENMSGGAEAITTYIASLNEHNKSRRRFLELGIVDSGLGYCKRWLADHPVENNNNINIQEEYKIFKKCFSFRSTSSYEDHKGSGLPVVMERLTKLKGFMKIRSGRLSLYRDFNNQPYHSDDECDFYDWQTKQISKHSAMSDVVGVSITLLIPMGDKS